MNSTYDYIIVGGGTAGCVLAARLSERTDVSVLLLEAGPDERPMLMEMPAGLGALYDAGRYHWPYTSQPEPGAGGKTQPYKMGRVLGGSSAINGLVWVRGNPRDFDDWDVPGWGWTALEPYFRKIERFESDDPAMGQSGPIPVMRGRPEQQILNNAFMQAAREAGQRINPNYNSGDQDGFCALQRNTTGGRRGDVRKGYLDPVRGRRNLTVLTDQIVNRVTLDGAVCTGVGTRNTTFAARREVILSAGSLASPQLLELSGIGEPQVLSAAGITPQIAVPAVGENLHTHPTISMTFECNGPHSILSRTRGLGKLLSGLHWITRKRGAAATNQFEAGAFLRAFDDSDRPDYQLTFLPLALKDTTKSADVHGYQVYVELISCRSRGASHVSSADCAVQPRFRFNFLDHPRDVAVYKQSVSMIRRIAAQPALAALTARETTPGPEITGPDALDRWIRRTAGLSHHLVGSCRMGTDSRAVVDPDLRVIGVQNLRVIDASIMPTVTSGNTHAVTIAIAEKGADLVRAAI